MALNGQTASVGKWDNTHLYFIDWTATQNIANNTSSVTARLRLQLLYNAGTWWSGYPTLPWTITVAGQSQSGNLQTNLTLAAGATYTLAERTFTVTHGTDGTKSFSISGSTATPANGGTASIPSGSWELDAIPRKTTITSVGNITTASTSIAVTLDRKHSTYTHSINLKLGSTSIATWTGTAANKTGAFTLAITAAQRTEMLKKIPSATSATGTLTVTTLSGTTTIGSDSKTFTVSVHSGAVPTLSSIATTVSTTYQISGTTKAVMAQTVGTLSFSVPWVMATGATLATRNTTFSGNANTNATGSFTSSTSGTKAITSTVTDSRGRTGTSTKNISVLPYTPVVLEVGYIGRGSTDTKLKVDTYQTVYNFNSENKYRLTIETRPKGGSWTTVHTANYTGGTSRVARSYTPTTTYTATSSYDVRVTLKDELTTASVVGTLGTSGLILALGKTGVGFGKLPSTGYAVDIGGTVQVDKAGTFNSTTPGQSVYGLHFAQHNADQAAGITWSGTTTGGQAGIYVQASGAYGTRMYFATTNMYATGAQTALSIDTNGAANFIRARPTVFGNTILDAGNYSTYCAPKSHTHAYVPTSRTVNGKALSANISLTAANVGAAPASHKSAYTLLRSSIAVAGNTTINFQDAGQHNMYAVYSYDSTAGVGAWACTIVPATTSSTRYYVRTYPDCYTFKFYRSGTTCYLTRDSSTTINYMVYALG